MESKRNQDLSEIMAEFALKLNVKKLSLTDDDEDDGFEDIILVFAFDKNVIRIDNIESEDENVNVKREILFQATREDFSKKLHSSLLMINLVRKREKLGTLKIEISEEIANSILCEEFSSEISIYNGKFIKNGDENAEIEFELEITCNQIDEKLKEFFRVKSERNEKTKLTSKSSSEFNPFTSDDGSMTYPFSNDPSLIGSDLMSKSLRSMKKKRCQSDIATSLNPNDFPNHSKTFCQQCKSYSISGVTCDNKIYLLPRVRSANALSPYSSSNLKSGCTSSRSVASRKSHVYLSTNVGSVCIDDLPKKFSCQNCDCKKSRKSLNRDTKQKEYFASDVTFHKKGSQTMKKCKRLLKHKEHEERSKNSPNKVMKSSSLFIQYPRCKKVGKKLKNQHRGLLVRHPGIVLGHRDCKSESALVPRNMGWLWNIKIPGIPSIQRGWKPGAVRPTIARIMEYFLRPKYEPAEPNILPCDAVDNPLSTLKVERKSGEYTIVMNAQNPPVIFKIAKSTDAKNRLEARKILKSRGIEKTCDCNTIEECECYNDADKLNIYCELKRISDELCLRRDLQFCELNDTSESEMNFEFTPPFATKKNLKSKNVIKKSIGYSQYEPQIVDKFLDSEDERIKKFKEGKEYEGLKGNQQKSKVNKEALKLKGNKELLGEKSSKAKKEDGKSIKKAKSNSSMQIAKEKGGKGRGGSIVNVKKEKEKIRK